MSTCIYEVDGVYLSALGVLRKGVQLAQARLLTSKEVSTLNFEDLSPINDKDAKALQREHDRIKENKMTEEQVQHYSDGEKWRALQAFVLDGVREYQRKSSDLLSCDEKDLPPAIEAGEICGKALALTEVFEKMKEFNEKPVEFDEFGRGVPLDPNEW